MCEQWFLWCLLDIYGFVYSILQGLYKSIPSCESNCNWGNCTGEFFILGIYWKFHHVLTGGFFQPALGPDGKKKEPESNVLLASIENMQYAVTVDVLHTVMNNSIFDFLQWSILSWWIYWYSDVGSACFRYSLRLVLSRKLPYLRRMVGCRL